MLQNHLNKGRRIRRKKIGSQLVSNYSAFDLTPNQEEFLNHGLNFCPRRRHFNKTEVVASIMDWQRKMMWREFWWRKKHERPDLEDISESDEESESEDENNNV